MQNNGDDEVYWLLTCTSTSCGNDLTCTERPSPDSTCVHFCGFQIDARDYGNDPNRAVNAMFAHWQNDCKRASEISEDTFRGGAYDDTTVHIGHLEDYTVKQCKYCGKEKAGTKKVIKVHDEKTVY